VNDIPLTRKAAQLRLEFGVRVGRLFFGLFLFGLFFGGFLVFDGFDSCFSVVAVLHLKGLVYCGIRFWICRFGDRVKHGIQVDVVAVRVDRVQRVVLCSFDGFLFSFKDVAGLRFVVLSRLLGSGRPVGVIAVAFRH
jgi:hypothetical protein